MSVDEITKLIYAFGLTGSVIGVSVFLMRLLDRASRRLDDMKKTTDNLGEISERVADNMDLLEESLELITGITRKLKQGFVDPLSEVFALFRLAKGIIPGLGEDDDRPRRKDGAKNKDNKDQEEFDTNEK